MARGDQPMDETLRRHIYGRLRTMDRPHGEPSFAQGTAIVIGLFVIGVLLAVALPA